MKINTHTMAHGKCKSCGDDKPEYFIQDKGKRKGERFLKKNKFVKVFEQVNWFRGDDEYLGTFCKECFKAKKYEVVKV